VPFRFSMASKSDLYKWYLQEISAGRFRYAAGPMTRETIEYKEYVRQHEELVREASGQYLLVHAAEEEDHDDAPDATAMMVNAARGDEAMPLIDPVAGESTAASVTTEGISSYLPWARGRASRRRRYN
jgi:hypothetical protein